MALTIAEENAELRQIIGRLFDLYHTDEVLHPFLHACNQHARVGVAADKEAARTFADMAYERVIGRPLTQQDIHELHNHRVVAADPLGGGQM
jgi:hypothetical protein